MTFVNKLKKYMQVLNNNVVLKVKEKEVNSNDIVNSSKDSDIKLLTCTIIEAEDKSLIGKDVLIGKYAGEKWIDGLYIAPFTALKIII